MIRLLKKMRSRELFMCLFCAVFILGQIYFDLRLPDYMSELTVLIQSADSDMSVVLTTGLRMLGCVLVSAVLCIVCGYLSARAASGFTMTVRDELFSHVMKLGHAEMSRFSVPSLITRTTNDVTQIQMVIAMGLQNLIKAPIMAVWAIIKILGKSRELSAITAVFVAVMCVSVLLIFSSVLPRFRIVQKLTDRLNRIAREDLTGINVVHAFNAEEYQNEKFEEANGEMFRTQLVNQRLFAAMTPILQLGMNGLSLTIYWVGAALLSAIPMSDALGRLTMFGDIVVFSTYATYVVMSFMMLVMIFMMLPAAEVSANRINEVLDTKPSVVEGTREDVTERGTVEFRDVTFRYPDSADDELSGIDFKVRRGETLAIIGSTGSGKTTLVGLIPRFYDTTSGEVLVDGVNVHELSFKALYDRIAYVTQRAVLFSGTIAENVSFGESGEPVTNEAVERAVELAQAEEFVSRLPEGTAHRIAQGGRNVSGGQKQRLSIARALARGAEILIFDDSFSALDYRTDARLRAGLSEKLCDTTKIIVAQRVGTIRHADRILVLDEGRIVGDGTHEELLRSCEVYREIARSQLSEEELSSESGIMCSNSEVIE